ncbi:hypothetical protein BLOT_005966 [Blomia tropicalis]|nr:hypothetical protein BLOT_005966 [Blomia tropicalis]
MNDETLYCSNVFFSFPVSLGDRYHFLAWFPRHSFTDGSPMSGNKLSCSSFRLARHNGPIGRLPFVMLRKTRFGN